MLKITRQEKILSILKDNGAITMNELMAIFQDTSKSTLRRDLIELSRTHPIKFTYGGVVLEEQPPVENEDELNVYGRKALELIHEDDIIFIDAGKTAHSVAKALIHCDIQNLTIVTTTKAVLDTLSEKLNYNWNIIILGGEYRGKYRSVVGPIAEQSVQNFKVETAFIGCTALDEHGFYTNYPSEVPLRNLVLDSSSRVVLLMKSNKFEIAKGYLVNSLDKIDMIITDNIPESFKETLQSHNTDILLCD